MTDTLDRIALAHVAPFALGPSLVTPAVRTITRDDGTVEIVEPRVMQVLVCLAQASGRVVSRDELSDRCWDGRIVGDDAINRVMSRLRRVADGICAGQCRIGTITKVGYRLVVQGNASARAVPIDGSTSSADASIGFSASTPRLSRRAIVAGGTTLLAAGTGMGALLWRRPTVPKPARAAQVAALLTQGSAQFEECTEAGAAASIGQFRRATEIAPEDGEAWGFLAMAYAASSRTAAPDRIAALEAQARGAIARAEALMPGQGFVQATQAYLMPRTRGWRTLDDRLARAARLRPLDNLVNGCYSLNAAQVGCMTQASHRLDRIIERSVPAIAVNYNRTLWLWGSGRLDEAERFARQALAMWPLSYVPWFTYLYMLMFSGRPSDAIAFAADRARRPAGIPEQEFAGVIRAARAIERPASSLADEVIEEALAKARRCTGHAENAMQYAAVLHRLDAAFMVADAYYLNRGFAVPSIRFPQGQGLYTYLDDRRSYLLFMPATAEMRQDRRFGSLLDVLGLERYWRETGIVPDFRQRSL